MPRSNTSIRRSPPPTRTQPTPMRPTSSPALSSVPPTAQTVQHNVVVEKQGFFANVWQGFGLGAGQAIAHNIFRSDPVVKQQIEVTKPLAPINTTTTELPREFIQCMKDNNNDTDLCKQFLGSAEKN